MLWIGRVDEERHQPRRIGLKGQLDHIEHLPGSIRKRLRIGNVLGRLLFDVRLRAMLPLLGTVQPLLQVTHSCEILIEPLLVGTRK